MQMMIAFAVVVAIAAVGYIGGSMPGLLFIFGLVLPLVAVLVFIIGFVRKVWGWAQTPVPFCISTTVGQQKSLAWITQDKVGNPSDTTGVIRRMAAEILLFRSLFRNVKAEIGPNGWIGYPVEKWLWLFAVLFHWSFLFVVIRHLRLFFVPSPALVRGLEKIDGFLLLDLQPLFLSGILLLIGVIGLYLRRVVISQVRYISHGIDFVPLFLIAGIAVTGILMRYVWPIDVVAVKSMTMGWVTLSPVLPANISPLFFVHLTLVSALLAWFPFSKMMHMGGIFLSPTRNQRANSREIRHVNPWDYPVHTHTYEEYEDEFRDKMKGCGLPVDKE
jgi:nitrate reductase gamma subunit